jgi:hypothetical protein
MRLQIEQQADGSLKGYGFYTDKNRDWEMVDVVQIASGVHLSGQIVLRLLRSPARASSLATVECVVAGRSGSEIERNIHSKQAPPTPAHYRSQFNREPPLANHPTRQ